MTHVLLLTMWVSCLTGWTNVLYFFACGVKGQKPNYNFTVYSLVGAIISLALGSICHSFVQSALSSYRMLGL